MARLTSRQGGGRAVHGAAGVPGLWGGLHAGPRPPRAGPAGRAGRWPGAGRVGQAAVAVHRGRVRAGDVWESTVQVPARARCTKRLRGALVDAVVLSGRAAAETARAPGVLVERAGGVGRGRGPAAR